MQHLEAIPDKRSGEDQALTRLAVVLVSFAAPPRTTHSAHLAAGEKPS